MVDMKTSNLRPLRLGDEKRKKEDEGRKIEITGQNIMACPIPYGGHQVAFLYSAIYTVNLGRRKRGPGGGGHIVCLASSLFDT